MQFTDRTDAGKRLAKLVTKYRDESPVVLGLPRGGVPVAFEVARALDAPLDVWVVRKVGAPGNPELGVGAVAEGGIVYLNERTMDAVGVVEEDIEDTIREKSEEVARRVRLFRGNVPAPSLTGKTVILVDDGIATGGTVHAAIQALRKVNPAKIVLAIPVAASQSLDELRSHVDDVACVHPTPNLYAIGAYYDVFDQLEDDEVRELLDRAHGAYTRRGRTGSGADTEPREISIPVGNLQLSGTLTLPESPIGLVVFAHGSGSSRFSPRNRHVADVLRRYGLATLLFDLLTEQEEEIDDVTAELRFDIGLLGKRLVAVTDWVRSRPELASLPLGYVGSSTGAAAALVAAADRPDVVAAVVSRGGRPDLAWDRLPFVRAPTLLVVGGEDRVVIGMNQRAAAQLRAPKRLVIVPGATHLFEEPGTLDAVARIAGEWLSEQLPIRGIHPGTQPEVSA